MITTVNLNIGITVIIYHNIMFTVEKIEIVLKNLKTAGSEQLIKKIKLFETTGTVKNVKIKTGKLTPFQKKVFKFVKTIPPGKTVTYKSVAEAINSHPIAVGQALKRNPLPLIVPCHRIIKKNSVGGFSYGLEIKKLLLNHEQNLC